MFICTPCLKKNYLNEPSFRVAHGRCEDCRTSTDCSEIHHSNLRLKHPPKKFIPLKVYALTLDIPYGAGLAIVIARSKKESIQVANNDLDIKPSGGTWEKPEKLPLHTKSKRAKILTHKYHFE